MNEHESILLPNYLDSKMIGKVKHEMMIMMMIKEVITTTPRQNDLMVKK